MQKCYNCGKEVDDNVLICPECGALVKRYTKPETQPEPEQPGYSSQPQPQPQAAVWRLENGKLNFRGYVTFWLVLCAIWFGYSLLGFGSLLLVYRFRDFYLTAMQQFEELQDFVQIIQALIDSVSAFPVYYIAVAARCGGVRLHGLVPRVQAEAGVLHSGRRSCAADGADDDLRQRRPVALPHSRPVRHVVPAPQELACAAVII